MTDPIPRPSRRPRPSESASAPRWLALGLLALSMTAFPAPPTLALFSNQSTAPVVVTADRLDPPTQVTCASAVVVCTVTVASRPQLTWTASVDAYTEGYRVFRSTTSGTGYVLVDTAVGRFTTAWTDSGAISPLTTYYYVVVAYGAGWTSATSPQVAVTVVL